MKIKKTTPDKDDFPVTLLHHSKEAQPSAAVQINK